MKNNFKRCLAMLLAVMMVVGACAFPISAADGDKPIVLDPNCEHTWEQKDTIAATCTEQGYELWYCSTCLGYEQRNVTPAENHDPEIIAGSDATCDADGVKGGVWCKKCETWLEVTNEPSEKLVCGDACKDGHVLDDECNDVHEWVLTTVGTLPCTDPNAKFEYECSVCKATAVANKTVAEHTYVFLWDADTFKAPTCTEEGSVQRVCSTCSEEQACREAVTVVIKSLGHTPEVNAEASKGDKCVKTCTRCDENLEYNHAVGSWTVDTDSTCKTEGVKSGVCEICKNTVTGVVAKKSHAYTSEVTTEPTCTAVGVKTFTCSNCDDVYTEEIKMLDHDWDLDNGEIIQEYVHASGKCDSEITKYTCKNCPATDEVVTKEAKHDDGDEIKKDSTCTEWGFSYKQCPTCGKSHSYTEIEPKPHVADETATPIKADTTTCVDGGYIYYPCKTCGTAVNNGEGIAVWQDATGKHDYSVIDEVKPTHLENGHYYVYCSVCNGEDTTKRNEGTGDYAAEGHKWYGDAADGEWSWTYGEGCEQDRYFYKWCTVAGCEFYCPVDPATYATDAEKNAALDIAFKTNLKLFNSDEHYEFIAASGHVNPNPNGEVETLKPADCKSHAEYGYICSCGTKIVTGYGTESDQNNHVGNMVLRHFVWACNNTTAEYFYSIYDCDACVDVNEIHIITKIGVDGIKLTTDETVAAGDDTYTLVESITIYVNGAANTYDNFVIEADVLEADAIGGNGTHAWTTVSDETCDVTGLKKCVICNYEEVIPVNENHKWEITAFDCVNGGTKVCKVCGIDAVIDPVEGGHTDPADADKIIADPNACKSEWSGECAHKDCTATVSGTIVNAEGNHKATIVGKNTYVVNQTTTLAFASIPSFITFKTTPTCANNEGSAEYACETCAEKFEFKVVVLLEHTYENNVVAENLVSAATCKDYAVYKKSCTACGKVSDETFEDVNAGYAEHKNVQVVDKKYAKSRATCLAKAVYFESCEWCEIALDTTFTTGDYADCKKTTAKEFSPVDPKLCTEYNYSVVEYCRVCDTVYTIADFEGKVGHVNGELVNKEATCQSPEYSYYKCEYCEIELEDTYVRGDDNGPHRNKGHYPLTGHCYFDAWKVDDKGNFVLDKDGNKIKDYVCDTCGVEFMPDKHLLGEPVVDKHTTTTTCTVCNVAVEVTLTCDEAKSWVEDETQYVAPTTTTTGTKVYVCSICGETKTEVLPVVKAIEFSLSNASPYVGGVLVNGGKAYVTIAMNSVKTEVSSIYMTLKVDSNVLTIADGENDRVLGNTTILGGDVYVSQTGDVVTIFASANDQQKFATLEGEQEFCVLVFDIVYNGWVVEANTNSHVDNNDKKSEVSITSVSVLAPATAESEGKPIELDVDADAKTELVIDQVADMNNDGIVDDKDAYLLRAEIEKVFENADYYNAIADINRDGELTNADLTAIRKYVAKIITTYLELAGFENK